MQKVLQHKPGDRLEVFERGQYVPCVILSIAGYAGKSGSGYYAAYDPPRPECASFWVGDQHLRDRANAA